MTRAAETSDPSTEPRAVHWLVRIAQRAGLTEEPGPEVPAGESTLAAWAEVREAVGLTDAELASLVAKYFRLQVADVGAADPEAAQVVPEPLCRKHHVFPLFESERQLVVATSDPTDVEAERVLGFTSGRTPVFQIAAPGPIQEAIDDRFSSGRRMEQLLGSIDDAVSLDTVSVVEETSPESITSEEVSAAPVVKLTNLILRDGIEAGASDIHLEPGRGNGVVRFRVDGVLRHHMQFPMAAMNRVVSRIKVLSKLDIADRLRPQDGKARVRINNMAYDLRVSTIPAGGAEKCVIRILDSSVSFTLDDLNLPDHELGRLREMLGYRDGIVLVTGPTGSGKTTTLYGALRELATGKINVMTVENPIEYELPGITQTQVETKQGVTFGSALRAMLRQDPDVILVGEIRDRETAETAAHAAMTGHLVLATVHANDAVAAVSRLVDLGLQWSTVASTLRGAVAQRLLRAACPSCAEPVRGILTPEEQRLTERHGVEPVVRAVGCPECGFTGYKGRIPVMEVMTVGARLQQAIELRKGHATLLRLSRQGGMRPMSEVGLEWVRQGKTTLVEVERVVGQIVEEEEGPETTSPRVLLVDPDEGARRAARSLLEAEGYEVTEAEDGLRALDVLKDDPDFSLMVLDLTMPRMDGREVLQRIRGSVDTAALPVLIRTGSGGSDTEAEMLDAGADDYISKGVPSNRFVARVRAVLRRAAL